MVPPSADDGRRYFAGSGATVSTTERQRRTWGDGVYGATVAIYERVA